MEGLKGSGMLPDLSRVEGLESILIVRLKALGDIALSLPIPRALRERYPGARIAYLCWEQYAEVLAGEGSVDHVIRLERGLAAQMRTVARLKGERFDMAIDLLGSPRSALLTFLSGARMRIGMDVGRHGWCYHHLLPRVVMVEGRRVKCYTLESNREIVRMLGLGGEETGIDLPGGTGRRAGECAIGLPAAELEREWAERYISDLGVDLEKLVGLVPAATYQSKSWPIEKFVSLGRMMGERYGLVSLVLWGPGEEETARRVADSVPGAICAPETGIARLGALISQMRLLVTTDSGPKHIAVLQGVPTVTLFGPTDPVIWDPMNNRHGVVYLDLPCAPCRKLSCVPNECLSGIEPEDVMRRVAGILGPDGSDPQRMEDSR